MVKKDTTAKVEQTDDAAAFFGAVLEEKNNAPVVDVPAAEPSEDKWLNGNFEGQLAVDVYQTEDDVIIQSTLAGVRVEDIDITVNNDMVTIRGLRRREQDVPTQQYFYQECYWGGFSRSIILPYDVKADKVSAKLKNGILTVVLPKANKPRAKSIKVHEEPDEDE
jgi:HSP20 family protein